MGKSDKKLNIIEDLLRGHDYGLTITDIMRQTGFARHTVLTRLCFLIGGGNVSMRQVNMAKLHYWIGDKDKEDIKTIPLGENKIKKVSSSTESENMNKSSSFDERKLVLEKRERELDLREEELVDAENELENELEEKLKKMEVPANLVAPILS